MAILAECSMCHKRQSIKNRLCACGEDLVRGKRSKKVSSTEGIYQTQVLNGR